MSDPWADIIGVDSSDPIWGEGYTAGYSHALAAVRPEYDRVCAERDAVRARCNLLEPIVAAARAWLDSPQPRDGEPDEMVVPLVRALDRLAAGQTEEAT